LVWQADFSIADSGRSPQRTARIRLSHLAFSSSSLPDAVSDAEAIQFPARSPARDAIKTTVSAPATRSILRTPIQLALRRGHLPMRFVHCGTHRPAADNPPA
jgi:hypothetical protein